MFKRVFYFLFALAFIILAGTSVMAQEKGKEGEYKDDKKIEEAIKDIYRRLDIGVKIFMDWYGHWGYNSNSFNRIANYEKALQGSGSTATILESRTKNNNEFRINRAYLDVKYKISNVFYARLTSDVDATVTPVAGSGQNPAFHIYLKYAYVGAKKDFGPVSLSAEGGMIETPIIGFIDGLSDFRWISQNYIDNSKVVLNNKSIDNSADVGVKASIGLFKYVTLTGSFTNGTGYKANENNSYKGVTYLVSIMPVKGLYLNGFGRNNIDTKYDYTGKKARTEFYGYGIAYKSDLIKIGFNHVFPNETTVGVQTSGIGSINVYPVQKKGYQILDSWLNFNLGGVVPTAPLLIVGRFVSGLAYKTYQKNLTDTELGNDRKTLLYLVGIGWQFNKNFRILVAGEIQRYIVKKDRYLRYVESTSSGTDYYNGNAIDPSLANLFVGSHNPNDARRLYVKAELAF
ncbi:MAG: hypothetical protein A2W19_04085 [Spirochaetes bacterium RBG_16_49_21]|nr:MAG: hypothetical protein A2W19_04085 [Spirochaetes bacterium RBG_16_49_21]